MHVTCDVGDGSSLELSQVCGQRLQPLRQSNDRLVAGSSCFCKISQIGCNPRCCALDVYFDCQPLIQRKPALLGVGSCCCKVAVSCKTHGDHLAYCACCEEGASLVALCQASLASRVRGHQSKSQRGSRLQPLVLQVRTLGNMNCASFTRSSKTGMATP